MWDWFKNFFMDIGWIILSLVFLASAMFMSDFFTGIGDKVFKKSND